MSPRRPGPPPSPPGPSSAPWPARRERGRRWLDALLLLMVFIWSANYLVIKAALREIPPQAFNAARMAVASAAIAAALAWTGVPRMLRRDWLRLAAIGAAGHFVYQVFFMSGIARTSVSNSSLIIGCSPVAVSIASALAGHERIARPQWAGILLSLTGVYLVVGLGAGFGGASLAGDLFTMGAVGCWAVYTVGARAADPLLAPHRHRPDDAVRDVAAGVRLAA